MSTHCCFDSDYYQQLNWMVFNKTLINNELKYVGVRKKKRKRFINIQKICKLSSNTCAVKMYSHMVAEKMLSIDLN